VALASYLAGLDLGIARFVFDALPALIDAARSAAAKVRDRFSPDGWQALNDMAKTARRFATQVEAGDDAARAMSVLLRKLSGFSGLVHENMYHFLGWRFLSLGRAQERADTMLMQLLAFAAPDAVAGSHEIAIELGDCIMTHQRRYRFGPSRETVLDLLALDADNPRAVLYQLAEMRTHLAALPRPQEAGARMSDVEKLLLELDTELRVATPESVSPSWLAGFRARLARVFDLLSAQYFR